MSVRATGGGHYSGGITKSATSTSHYSCQLDVTAADLADKWITGFTYYSGSRGSMTGDSYINCDFTYNGTTYTPTTSWPCNQVISMGNSLMYFVHADQRGHAVFFSKPVQLSAITCRCGSAVGQWAESDSLYLLIGCSYN